MGKISVSKLDAAERQRREANVMHFEERDPVAIHTLACAASQVTADLMKAKGLPSMVRGGAMIREDRCKEVLKVMVAPENFFKHADRDPNEVIEFDAETTELPHISLGYNTPAEMGAGGRNCIETTSLNMSENLSWGVVRSMGTLQASTGEQVTSGARLDWVRS